jgi:hypothetical protein
MNFLKIEGPGFIAQVADFGFTASLVHAQHSIPRDEVESYLFRRGYDLRGAEWEFVPDALTPKNHTADTADLPLGRVVKGEGWRASLRYTSSGFEAIYLDGADPRRGVAELKKQGVPLAKGCVVWRIPAPEIPTPGASDAHRKRFFGVLKARRQVFRVAGVTEERLKRYYYRRFGVESLSSLTPAQWAEAAAEVSCMGESVLVLHARAHEIRVSMA